MSAEEKEAKSAEREKEREKKRRSSGAMQRNKSGLVFFFSVLLGWKKKIVLTKSIEAKNPSARTRSRFLSVPPPHTKSIYKTTEEKNITKSHHAAARDAALLGRVPPRREQRRLGLDQRAERGLELRHAHQQRAPAVAQRLLCPVRRGGEPF